MKQPSISVILPVYGVEKFLPECLASLDAQTLQPLEVILVDDGSPDQSGELCEAWARQHSLGPAVRVIHQENRGLSGARNTGIRAAKGEYLAFIDPDDTVAPAYLEKLYEAITRTGADMAVCGAEDVAEDGSSLAEPALTRPEPGEYSGRALLDSFYAPNGQAYTVAWNKLYRASLWEHLAYPQGKINEDDAVAHRLYLACDKVVCLPDILYYYRLRQGSICRAGVSPASFDAVEALLDRCFCYRAEGLSLALAARACWKNYLYLSAQAAKAPTEALAERINELQPAMKKIPTAGLRLTEKLSARRWAGQNAFALLGLDKK